MTLKCMCCNVFYDEFKIANNNNFENKRSALFCKIDRIVRSFEIKFDLHYDRYVYDIAKRDSNLCC